MADVTSDPGPAADAVLTLRERMRAAGLSDERIAFLTEANAVALDGEIVRDPDQPMQTGTRWHFVDC